MDKDSRDKRFIRKPIFKGGNKAFSKFIYSQLRYPKEALENKIEGLVIVRYDIGHNGKVTKPKVISGIGYGCDEEAMRVVKLLEFEIPKGPRKLKIIFHRTTRIKFTLPKNQKATPKQSVSYQYVKKKIGEKQNQRESKVDKSYTYNISW